MNRIATTTGALVRAGLRDLEAAQAILARHADWLASDPGRGPLVLVALQGSPDPDQALGALDRLCDADPERAAVLTADPRALKTLVTVMGVSPALGQHVAAHPEDLDVLNGPLTRRDAASLRADLLTAVGADPSATCPVATEPSDALRLAYRRGVLRIAARDLTSPDATAVVDDIAGELSDLADAVLETALALARANVPGWETTRLGVVALGKCGARELNYVSDVDVLYIAEPVIGADGEPVVSASQAVATASKMVGYLSRECSAHTGAGTIWPVDAALRPEGKAGPLVRTLASMTAYYEKWAKDWEFQAMLKARPAAGDLALAQDFVDMVWPLVWSVGGHEGFVGNVQAMRKRVISLIPEKDADAEIKLGAGGLRDTEFSVQLLQLVHGRADERVRLRGTFEGLDALVAYGYVGREDGAKLEAAYRFQRVLEHRAQLEHLRRTHLFPSDEASRRRMARSVGLSDPDALADMYRSSKRQVLRLHRRLFYSPLLEAVSRIPSDAVKLTSDAAETRLRALGYHDPASALRHIEAMTSGVSRQAEIQRQLLPAMLGWFAEGPNPDHGLLAFRQVSEALGSTSWYLRALRDEGEMAENLARVLASSRMSVGLLERNPQSVQLLSDPESIRPRTRDDILAEMRASARRHDDPARAVEAIRAVRREEMFRLSAADLLADLGVEMVGRGLAELMGATIDAALDVALRGVEDPPRLAVIAMGRWGGNELSYSSDADALIVCDDTDDPGALRKALAIVKTLRTSLSAPGPDPALEIDLDLRPEGKGGPMVRTLASYGAYYAKWGSTWESQALLRAQFGAGDVDLAARFLESIDPIRYPEDGLTSKQVTEIRKLKARMEAERMPRAGVPAKNVKLGPGGLSDVEWVVQLLQLEHGGEHPGLRTPSTLPALAAEGACGLIEADDVDALRTSWLMASRIRNAIMQVRGKASDALPTDAQELASVAEVLGYERGTASQLIEDWSRHGRVARRVMDRLFWGLD